MNDAKKILKGLSTPMRNALATGRNDEILMCEDRTYAALVRRDLVHFRDSNLTALGVAVLAELDRETAQAAQTLAERRAAAWERVEAEKQAEPESAPAAEPETFTLLVQTMHVTDYVDGRQYDRYEDRYTVHAGDPEKPVDGWRTESRGYDGMRGVLDDRGWELIGEFEWDKRNGTHLATVKHYVEQPEPEVIEERVSYRIQRRALGTDRWFFWTNLDCGTVASATARADELAKRWTSDDFRVVKITETWTTL
jgi:hypothetical protein